MIGVGARLARAELGRPLARTDAGTRLAAALGDGLPLDAALARAGFGAGVVAAFSAPGLTLEDPRRALERLAEALERDGVRRRVLRAHALYALWLLLAVAGLWALVTLFAFPELNSVLQARQGPVQGPSLPVWPLALAGGVGAALLAWVVAALGRRTLLPPFHGFARICDRALSLTFAAELAAQGCPLPAALRSASALCLQPAVRRDAMALAQALERGEAEGPEGAVWLGALGAGLLRALAAQGHGRVSLEAAAALWDAQAAAELPFQRLRAELHCLGAAGAALLAAGAAYFLAYGRTFAGG